MKALRRSPIGIIESVTRNPSRKAEKWQENGWQENEELNNKATKQRRKITNQTIAEWQMAEGKMLMQREPKPVLTSTANGLLNDLRSHRNPRYRN